MLELCRTYVARNATHLIQKLNDIKIIGSPSHTLLFSISPSPSLPEAELGKLVSTVSKHPKSIGCLSGPIRTNNFRNDVPIPTVCSIAAFDARNATSFRSTIPGKEPTQVGRWHAFRNRDAASPQMELPKDSEGIDWESVWAKPQTNGTTPTISSLSAVE